MTFALRCAPTSTSGDQTGASARSALRPRSGRSRTAGTPAGTRRCRAPPAPTTVRPRAPAERLADERAARARWRAAGRRTVRPTPPDVRRARADRDQSVVVGVDLDVAPMMAGTANPRVIFEVGSFDDSEPRHPTATRPAADEHGVVRTDRARRSGQPAEQVGVRRSPVPVRAAVRHGVHPRSVRTKEWPVNSTQATVPRSSGGKTSTPPSTGGNPRPPRRDQRCVGADARPLRRLRFGDHARRCHDHRPAAAKDGLVRLAHRRQPGSTECCSPRRVGRRTPPPTAATLAAPGLELSTGVAVAFPRSPMITAQVAWELQEATGGSFRLGLGTQVRTHVVRRYGVEFEHPGPRLRDYVLAVKACFAGFRGEPLDHHGEFYELTFLNAPVEPGRDRTARPEGRHRRRESVDAAHGRRGRRRRPRPPDRRARATSLDTCFPASPKARPPPVAMSPTSP